MTRPPLIPVVKFVCLLLLAAAAGALLLAILYQTLCGWGGNTVPGRGRDALAVPNRVSLVIHGVNDDGAVLSGRIKEAVDEGPAAGARPKVYLFRWTQPDGERPALGHARNSLRGIEARRIDGQENEATYQVAIAGRLRDFLIGARRLYRDYGVDGHIDVVAHSQGTLITLEALDRGGEADNVVFLGSPLCYTGDRQDDVIGALPHVRGVLYNYFTPSDTAIRLMGGFTGAWFLEPRGWPQGGLPKDKVVQAPLNVPDHTSYYTEDAIRTNYLDKLAAADDLACRLPADEALEFTRKWNELTADAGLIEPQ